MTIYRAMRRGLLVMAVTFLALIVARNSRAQEGGWGSGDAAGLASEPLAKVSPVDAHGCWTGAFIGDTGEGDGAGYMTIEQKKSNFVRWTNHNANGSCFDWEYADMGFAFGSITGKSTTAGMTFKASAGGSCSISGTAIVTPGTEIIATYVFHGNCALPKGTFGTGMIDLMPTTCHTCVHQ